jgi:signal transduction histidine kinase
MRLLDEQVERIRLIVQQLLQHARPEEYAGYVEALDVNQVLKDCQVLVNHRLHSAGIRVVLDEGATRAAPFNRQELQQVLINLLINACNAMPQGGVLTLRTRDCPHGQEGSGGFGGGVTIEVQDTGPGLAPETLERLFQPFFTTYSDGHGLGLWISLSLVERYGGDIRARHAVPGPGAVFTVYLRADS